MSYAPSPQQADAIEFVKNGRGNAILKAVAGAGKTTTLIQMCSVIPPRASVAFAAYNKKIAVEIQEKLTAAGVGRNVRAGTFHSFGFGAWRKVAPDVKVEEKKVERIIEEMKVPDSLTGIVKELVSLAKQRAVGVLERASEIGTWRDIVDHFGLEDGIEVELDQSIEEVVDEACRWAYRVLARSIKLNREAIDFDDMIFAPLVHNVRMWQNDFVFIDEAQDTNPARRALAKKMLKTGGRLIAVGDPHQAIYGFTGADNDALDVIAREFSCRWLNLTVTYRCPKTVVAMAQNWVSHITAHDSAPEGLVRVIDGDDFGKESLELTDAILCRNTKPLVELAFQLIRRRITCHVEGREIGQGIMKLARKWKKVKLVGELRDRLMEYLEKETERLMAKGQETKADALKDKVDTLMVLMESLADDDSVEELAKVVDSIFQDTNGRPRASVTLSTVHKSKGREWPRVYLIGRNKYMPSPFARQDWQMAQEDNLIYVAVTRAQEELVEVLAK